MTFEAIMLVVIAAGVWAIERRLAKIGEEQKRLFNLIHTIRIHFTGS